MALNLKFMRRNLKTSARIVRVRHRRKQRTRRRFWTRRRLRKPAPDVSDSDARRTLTVVCILLEIAPSSLQSDVSIS